VHSAGGHFGTANIIIAKIFVRKYFTNDGNLQTFLNLIFIFSRKDKKIADTVKQKIFADTVNEKYLR
jgi:hypothetical protein